MLRAEGNKIAPGASSDEIQGATGTFTFTGSPQASVDSPKAPVGTPGPQPSLSSQPQGRKANPNWKKAPSRKGTAGVLSGTKSDGVGSLGGDLPDHMVEELLTGSSPKPLCTACTTLRDENLSLRLALTKQLIVQNDAKGDVAMLSVLAAEVAKQQAEIKILNHLMTELVVGIDAVHDGQHAAFQ
jgi:hypothetical protein